MARTAAALRKTTGVGQLTLVEHALCPLDARSSLTENLVFDTRYFYTAVADAGRLTARARVFCPLGLSAADELYLWGLLALTLLQPDPQPELSATPHWCLRQLGVINQASKRGGRQYHQFAEAIRRLSAVTYMCDAFYDPVRGEHRRVSFRFFSYSLPSVGSSRAWRIVWDPLFFEIVKATTGHFRFDLAVYRELDAASRRLFLFSSKVLSRISELKALPLEHVAIDLLGFSPTLATRELKAKVGRCLAKLTEFGVLVDSEVFRTRPGKYFVRLGRGPYFAAKWKQEFKPNLADSPLFDTLLQIGFEEAAAARLMRKYPPRLLSEWADITQAAKERFGRDFFKRSPMAYFVDSVSKAAAGNRTAPDWWHELKRAENQKHELTEEGKSLFTRLRSELFGPDVSVPSPSAVAAKKRPVATIADILSKA